MSDSKKTINIHIPETQKCGSYSNLLAVSLNQQEVVLDFAYRMPGNEGKDIQVVSRINMSHATAKQVVTTLQNSLLDFENKKKTS